jgi:hypothetical protein
MDQTEYCKDYHCAGDCGQPHNQKEMQGIAAQSAERPNKPFLVQSREAFEYNTDPMGRCYNGCFPSSAWKWSEWSTLSNHATLDEAEAEAQSWRDLNKNVTTRKLEYRVKG